MKLTADLHIHSHYSRATSKTLDFEHLAQWAQLKGVNVVGSGDLSHPGWLQEMHDKLQPTEDGLFRLKDDVARAVQANVPAACQAPVRFLLSGEISSIYKKNDRVRKIHNVIFAPTLDIVQKIQAELEKIGNIRSDGRPILGLDSRDLLEIILTVDPQNHLIPAHIWTPWFSLLGSKSGFDTVQECFDDLTPHIFAVETGLSSDPPMNWRISMLDDYTLVSHSDAHSPPKLAREATLFDTDLSYTAIFEALKSGAPPHFLGTVEFFPEEGKYHMDGHRKCGTRWTPETTQAHDGRCAICGKPVTVGVMHRVDTLADRPVGATSPRARPFHSIIPLPEILSEVHQVGPTSKRVKRQFDDLLAKLGPELYILQEAPLEDIAQTGGPLLAEGIRRMRNGELHIAAGFDGEFGVIKLFDDHERDAFAGQLSFAPAPQKKRPTPPAERPATTASTQPTLFKSLTPPLTRLPSPTGREVGGEGDFSTNLNPQQQTAACCIDTPLLIVAGPGTGKTRTLTHRIAHLIREQGQPPESILAITFTNKAAEEMAERLAGLLDAAAGGVTIKTFHAFGALLLRAEAHRLGLSPQFAVVSDDERVAVLKQAKPALGSKEAAKLLEQISAAKNQLLPPYAPELSDQPEFVAAYQAYEAELRRSHLLDFDDLLLRLVQLFEAQPDVLDHWRQRFRWISVDEYQDINLAQYRLLRLLTGPEVNLCAIGDPDQAIYGFRGADRGYFLRFQQDFPQAQVLHLTRNYRSTQSILAASGQVIAHNPDSRRLELTTAANDPFKLTVYATPTDKAEAEYVVHSVEQMMGGTSYFSLDSGRLDDDSEKSRTFADFAVLYRLGAQSGLLVEAFERSGIPYQTIGQTPLTEYRDVKTALAYLWLVFNPASRLHLAQVAPALNAEALQTVDDDLLAAIASPSNFTHRGEIESSPAFDSLKPAQRRQLTELIPLLTELRNAFEAGQPVTELVDRAVQLAESRHFPAADEARTARFAQLRRRAALFEADLGAFLESTALQRETDQYDPRADRVTLMTLHAAKGLEFPVVFIVGCEEDLLPYHRAGEPVDVAEERRLFYVGMTRARQQLILTRAQSRFLFGQSLQNEPSRFVAEIEASLKEIKEATRRKPSTPKAEDLQLKLF